MSRVKLSYQGEIEFYMDFSKLESDSERIVAFLLFSIYNEEDSDFVVEKDDLYISAEKCGISHDEVHDILEKFEKEYFVMQDMNLIILTYDCLSGKRKADLKLGNKEDLKIDIKRIWDNVFPDVSPDSEEE